MISVRVRLCYCNWCCLLVIVFNIIIRVLRNIETRNRSGTQSSQKIRRLTFKNVIFYWFLIGKRTVKSEKLGFPWDTSSTGMVVSIRYSKGKVWEGAV